MIDHAMLSRLMTQCDIEPDLMPSDVMELAKAIFMAGKDEARLELERKRANGIGDKIIQISELCDKLSGAAKKLGFCEEAMACIDAQKELMEPYYTEVFKQIDSIKNKEVR